MGSSARRRDSGHAVRVLGHPAYSNRDANPYNTLLSAAVMRTGAEVREFRVVDLARGWADVWHLHWPEAVLRRRNRMRATLALLRIVVLFAVARAWRTSIVWTVHNTKPHETQYPLLWRLLERLVVMNIDGWIALSDDARGEVVSRLPRMASCPATVILHGHYRDWYSRAPSCSQARDDLGIADDSRVILYFGLIRPYKNVPHLLRTFTSLQESDVMMIVAGDAKEPLASEVATISASDDRIRFDQGFIPSSLVPRYFGAANLAVFPFTSILNSGSVILALSFNTPVLVPDSGSMNALREAVGAPWVTQFYGQLDAQDLKNALAAADQARGEAPLQALAWEHIGPKTEQFYRRVLKRKT